MVIGDFISRLSFPGRRIVFHSKKAYAALISWNICLFAKACLRFSGENTETFSSLTSYPELRRSEFLIRGYVGARASLLLTTPPFVAIIVIIKTPSNHFLFIMKLCFHRNTLLWMNTLINWNEMMLKDCWLEYRHQRR